MKLALLSVLLIATSAFARDRIGNGGGLWACIAPDQSVSKGMLVDLFEAREEFKLHQIQSAEKDPMKIVRERADFLRLHWSEMSQNWDPILANVLPRLDFTDAELEIVDDALIRIKPSHGCAAGWQYVQFANFTNLGHVLIRQDLWSSANVGALDKAALIWHEVIYRWLRETQGDANSVRARLLVGLLFSDLDPEQMKIRMTEALAASPGQDTIPVLKLNSPVDGATLSGTQTVFFSVQASLVTQPIVYVYVDDGVALALLNSAPYEYSLKTKSLPNGRHRLYGAVYAANGTVESNGVTVYIQNKP